VEQEKEGLPLDSLLTREKVECEGMSVDGIENNNNESNVTIKTIISTCSLEQDDKGDSIRDKTRSGIRYGDSGSDSSGHRAK